MIFFFFPHTLPLNCFYINETESKLLPPPTQRTWHFPKSQILCFVFIPWKHAAADWSALRSTRPTCPRWRPPQRRALWRPLCGRSNPPLSSCQLRGAEMTSCYSSSSADHHPPEKREVKEMRGVWEEAKGWWWWWECKIKEGKVKNRETKDENNMWKSQFINQSVR